MHVLATFSYNVAKHLGDTGIKAMQVRNRVQLGMAADIVVLDPAAVIDNATYANGMRPTTGIPYVLVNGKVVVSESKVLPDTFPGESIRFPVEDQNRFEPLCEEVWARNYLTARVGFHSLDDD